MLMGTGGYRVTLASHCSACGKALAAALRDSGLRLTVRSGTYPLPGAVPLESIAISTAVH